MSVLGICAAVGIVAGILALLGYGFFDGPVFVTVGALVGGGVADLSARAFGRRWRTVFGLAFAWLLSAMSYFLVPYGWLYTDSGTFWDSEETFVYWLVQGAVIGLAVGAGTLVSTLVRGDMSQEEARRRRKDLRKSLLILGGTVLGIFGLFFLAYVLLEYVLTPVLRLIL